jgi:hypothetical protein
MPPSKHLHSFVDAISITHPPLLATDEVMAAYDDQCFQRRSSPEHSGTAGVEGTSNPCDGVIYAREEGGLLEIPPDFGSSVIRAKRRPDGC